MHNSLHHRTETQPSVPSPLMEQATPWVRFSTITPWLAGWCVRLIALAMVAAIGLETYRASTREGFHFILPPAIGLACAIATILLRQPLWDLFTRACTKRSTLVLLLLVPFLFQLSLIVFVHTRPVSDYQDYWRAARTLWNTGEYVPLKTGFLEFRARKPPGMTRYLSLIYGLFGEAPRAGQLFNALLLLGGNVIFYYLLRKRVGDNLAVCATALFALWPSRSFSAALLGYDAPGSFAILLFWLLVDGPWRHRALTILAAGVVGGAATLLRQPVLLPAVFATCGTPGWRCAHFWRVVMPSVQCAQHHS